METDISLLMSHRQILLISTNLESLPELNGGMAAQNYIDLLKSSNLRVAKTYVILLITIPSRILLSHLIDLSLKSEIEKSKYLEAIW